MTAGPSGRVSARLYFLGVVLATSSGFAVATLMKPALAHSARRLFGFERSVEAQPSSFYVTRVAPLLETHCTACHGARRQKAELRLDTFVHTMRGSKNGQVIVPHDAQHSELFSRISLAPSDEKFMPPGGRPPLTADDITVIKLWIAAGASGTVAKISGAPSSVAQVKFVEIDDAAVESSRASLSPIVKSLQSKYPTLIKYESRGSANLEVNASLFKERSFGDAELHELAPLRDRIVWADFSGTAVSDASASMLSAMRTLRVLRLMNTEVTDTTIHALASLPTLQTLNVVGTGATEAALAPLRKKGVRIYRGDKDE